MQILLQTKSLKNFKVRISLNSLCKINSTLKYISKFTVIQNKNIGIHINTCINKLFPNSNPIYQLLLFRDYSMAHHQRPTLGLALHEYNYNHYWFWFVFLLPHKQSSAQGNSSTKVRESKGMGVIGMGKMMNDGCFPIS